jgi:hypothetical protein
MLLGITRSGNVQVYAIGVTSPGFIATGATSGSLTIKAPAVAGTNTLTLPAGTTDFSSTGGTSQVVKQTSSGGALTVARLACADLSDTGNACSATYVPPTSWTPVLNFATPGTSSFSYSSQQGRYQIVGGWMTLEFFIQFTPTVGTGSGDLQISLPVNCHDTIGGSGVVVNNSLITWPTSHTQLVLMLTSGSKMVVMAIGSAQNGANIGASNVISGTANHQLSGSFSCPVI